MFGVASHRTNKAQTKSWVVGIALRRPGSYVGRRPVSTINVAETLMHEMGHVLGLGHPESHPFDIMAQNHRGHHRHSSTVYVGFSDRDLAVIAWLYDQTSFVPILSLYRR